LPELEFESARIKLQRDRHELVELERALRRIRERLDQVSAPAPPPPL
jgi:hypothetical protein